MGNFTTPKNQLDIKQEMSLANMMLSLKDPAVFLGIMYFISFIITLPIALKYRGGVLNYAEFLLVSIVAIGLVHIFINWLYYLTVTIPLIMSVIFFVVGWIMWLFTPFIGGIIDIFFSALNFALTSVFNFSYSGGGTLNYFSEFMTRFSQTLMAIGGALWWLVKKAKDIDYKALAVYLVSLSLFGIISGFLSTPGLVMFLVVWAVVDLKIRGDKNIPEMQTIFKVIATIAILFNAYSARLINNAIIFQPLGGGTFDSIAYENFLKLYNIGLAILMLLCTWFPNKIIDMLPDKARIYIDLIYKRVSFIKIKANL
ncbi:hypothetical protein VTU32_06525 [Thermoanaerobacter sp. CM-CNRG TB177]|uniref:hypothetical protein n=1 Tax=Thermoanaerobacter sp. CM-CNRG TB177 TaxID=2800659 RepID=UPI001BDF1BAD|nr:hypothetical protein [Thermoanaerobacter sp. CM-CNRG TB177]MBT1278951.1 hypothetical protein [Thermoanaerobacter sp. CM-CNRG TB177]